jgi:hypothetical protein
MELPRKEKRMVGQLDHLHEAVVGRDAAEHQPVPLQQGAVLVVHLVAVAVSLVNHRVAVHARRQRVRQ